MNLPITLGGGNLPVNVLAGNVVINGQISDNGSPQTITLNGPGALTLNGSNNTYSGGTVLAGGLLNLGNASALGTGPLTISGGSLDNTSGAAMTLSNNNPLNLNGSFVFLGSNPLNTGYGTVTLGAPTTAAVSGSGALTVGGPIGGLFPLTKNGPGTLVLAADNSYAGATTVSGGMLVLAGINTYTGGTTVSGGTLLCGPLGACLPAAPSPSTALWPFWTWAVSVKRPAP